MRPSSNGHKTQEQPNPPEDAYFRSIHSSKPDHDLAPRPTSLTEIGRNPTCQGSRSPPPVDPRPQHPTTNGQPSPSNGTCTPTRSGQCYILHSAIGPPMPHNPLPVIKASRVRTNHTTPPLSATSHITEPVSTALSSCRKAFIDHVEADPEQ